MNTAGGIITSRGVHLLSLSEGSISDIHLSPTDDDRYTKKGFARHSYSRDDARAMMS